MTKNQTTKKAKVGVTGAKREKTGAAPVVTATTDHTTRDQRDRVREARKLKGPELKTFVARHREELKAVAAATGRRVVSVEAQKLLGVTPKTGKGN